ncbi:TetR/AcrR family transcriptional regulator [Acinetobacter sp. ANC 3882]|uniref:TetR/AcrR family transcriptional regulator n=1 Tax=Acinetobacter sp. ANC 3882 TaxID=2923423 RepID=UPI001F4AA674|nr:TetR/AcrR family transcriptional regulator [Acinetobacter sp. ANC 3882]MCH7313107.1 TetR/AcrR family transcriptional regulator [Acinetobacter sp. ANC 3882]
MQQSSETTQPNPKIKTKFQLIEVAIPLFAEGGLSTVSIRDINQAAGIANQSAIYYHFGDMWGLVTASFSYALAPYISGVNTMLDQVELESDGISPPALNKIVDALIRPMVRIIQQPDGLHKIKFIARIIGGAGDKGRKLVADEFRELTLRCNQLVVRSLPGIGEEAASVKVLFAFNSVINIISDIGLERYWPLVTQDTRQIDRYLHDYIEGGIRFNA